MHDWIHIKGARQHNLKNIDVSIPKNRLVVITGPSGAGKSSLAFDTLYAEGQRRYVESLSPGARQFLTQMDKADVDSIEGLGPAVAIGQRAGAANPRSTVGTATEIYDFLRLLFARVGRPVCWKCGRAILAHTVQQIVDAALAWGEGARLLICAPLPPEAPESLAGTLQRLQGEGFVRFLLGEAVLLLEQGLPADPPQGPVALVVDRLAPAAHHKQRITEAVELGLDYGGGLIRLVCQDVTGKTLEEAVFSRTPRCVPCGITYPEPHPRAFSFNSPFGACTGCEGLGRTMAVSPQLVVPDEGKTLAEGAVAPWERRNSAAFHGMIEQVAAHYGFSIFTPFRDLGPKAREVLLHGSGAEELEFSYDGEDSGYRYTRAFEGVVPSLARRFRETESASVREEVRRYMTEETCADCHGARLNAESLHFHIDGLSIADFAALNLAEAQARIEGVAWAPGEVEIARRLVTEISERLGFLQNVGLHYLSLHRSMDSLSSGETQRIRLATQLGSALTDVIYILDEPTIGLHQRDTGRLLHMLEKLRDSGSTVVVVEHDRETLLRADYLIEIGPQAGEQGGRLVAQGAPGDLEEFPGSTTGEYLSGRRSIPVPAHRRTATWQKIALKGAIGHNLKNVDLTIPLGMFTCVTGVSGSGKSTLVFDTLYPALVHRLTRKPLGGQPFTSLEGFEYLERVVHVDQAPIGRSARSNPGTYLGVFSTIREHFAALPESRARGYGARRFSFNVDGGRCGACQGEGTRRIEMHFLPDVFVRCDVCEGARFNRETLEIRFRGKTIADILQLSVVEVERFFRNIPAIRPRLETLIGVGLGYLRLGQPANTLSAGEAQRLKIARELGRREGTRTLYLLDEPTTGLHFGEVERMVEVFNQLIEAGNTVVVIEHNLDMIKCADHVIDLGPEAGEAGGSIVAQGTPEQLLAFQAVSHTAASLKSHLQNPAEGFASAGGDKESVLH